MCSAITLHLAGRFENLDLLFRWRAGGRGNALFLRGYLGRTAHTRAHPGIKHALAERKFPFYVAILSANCFPAP